jgi:hypothetical protein
VTQRVSAVGSSDRPLPGPATRQPKTPFLTTR